MALTLIIWMNGDSMLSTLVEMKTHTQTSVQVVTETLLYVKSLRCDSVNRTVEQSRQDTELQKLFSCQNC